MSNLFWPIYRKLESEFTELSYYISIDKQQLKTYSIKIADLILRAVSECENIAKELCKKEKIKFRDKKGQIRDYVTFHEYIEELDKMYNLKYKLVACDFENIKKGTFDIKHDPFRKERITRNGKDKEIWRWYNSYNLIKHDRIKNFKEANMGNLINSLAALFLLNVYYMDKDFYLTNEYSYETIISKIEGFSEVFKVDYTLIPKQSETRIQRDNFVDPYSYFEIAKPYSTYIIETDKEYKTDSDRGADLIDKLESKVMLYKDGVLTRKYDNYELRDHKTVCSIVASLNKSTNNRKK
ncbi:hypothetical protein G9G54_14145 [Paenibacillus sp. EKM212P]|uniref:hypothetical protein n=1 Tax=Paenibacillus sp. EKM212P TaxID=1683680 RepID=UPI0013EBBA05|nr:hypothetical protein [Paenibacillus sp. EKM212P]KAF6578407.1 hypothetical protein G9G54_14145 [Paenibacillus sp. EKM212P]